MPSHSKDKDDKEKDKRKSRESKEDGKKSGKDRDNGKEKKRDKDREQDKEISANLKTIEKVENTWVSRKKIRIKFSQNSLGSWLLVRRSVWGSLRRSWRSEIKKNVYQFLPICPIIEIIKKICQN